MRFISRPRREGTWSCERGGEGGKAGGREVYGIRRCPIPASLVSCLLAFAVHFLPSPCRFSRSPHCLPAPPPCHHSAFPPYRHTACHGAVHCRPHQGSRRGGRGRLRPAC